jgi:N-acetylmuramoyl-L-alanine amidase
MQLKDYKSQSTKGIEGLSNQLCAEAVDMGFLVPFEFKGLKLDDNSLVHLYLNQYAAKSLGKVCNEIVNTGGEPLEITTAYRTLAQQAVLKRNLPGLVAAVGRSDHGNGKSLDILNWDNYRSILTKNDWTQTYPDNDAVHWDSIYGLDKRSSTILAFQRLYNRNNASKLTEDGDCGAATLNALLHSPIDGFVDAKCPRFLSYGAIGKDVGKVQLRLRELGHYAGVADGVYGVMTQTAVISYQMTRDAKPTGVIGGDILLFLLTK